MPIRPENRARYPANWAEIRAAVLERAGHKCEWCGAVDRQPHPVTGSHVVLTTAHVHDRRPEACDMGNLAALCQKCHNTHDARDRAANAAKRREAERLKTEPTLDL